MRIKGILFTGLIFTAAVINGQADFRPGYIIRSSGDTLKGEIDYRGDRLMGEICSFRTSGDEEIKYAPDDILAYRYNDGKYFISKEISGKKVFLEFLIKGKISVYFLRDRNGDHYFIEKEGLGLAELPYKDLVMYENNTSYEFATKKHIGLLNYYMQDAPDFQSRIASIGKPGQQNLVRLAAEYHNLVCKDEECVVFAKRSPLMSVDIEIVAGIISYRNGIEMDAFDSYYIKGNLGGNTYMQGGVLTHFWLPRMNEKLFFRTGILYSTFKSGNTLKKFVKIPVQIEYVYPKGIIRPTFAYGVNICKPFFYTVGMMAGLNIKLRKSVFLGINCNVDFLPKIVPVFPGEFQSYTVFTGLYKKF